MHISEWSQVPMSAKSGHSFPIEGVHGKRNSTLIYLIPLTIFGHSL